MVRRLLILALLLALPFRIGASPLLHAPGDSALFRLVYMMKHAMLFNQTSPQEKVYLHFDNTGYFKGETMFFKAYSIRTDTGKPSNISKVLHVELLNPSGDIVERCKVKMEDGVGNGYFKLDSIFGTGFYEVRAFTRYMMNWGGGGAFSRVFPIYKKPKVEGDYFNPQVDELTYLMRLPDGRASFDQGETPAVRAKRRGKSYTVSFYPEGGHLVEGIESTVAFSVLDGEGKHAKVMGIVTDPQGNSIITTSTEEDGRGIFTFTPMMGKYNLVLTTEEGKRLEFPLPEAQQQGCVMHVDAISDEVSCLIKSSEGIRGQLLGYTLMNRGQVISYDTLSALPAIQIDFSRREMQPGVNQLTLFNEYGQILAERLIFICPPRLDADSIHVTTLSNDLRPCGKVQVRLKSEPLSSLSFSAMDAATLTDGKVGNAQTWMLLSSEVKGYIENPDYYFEADDVAHRKAADLLMMVQGWRRYDWQLYTGVKKFSEVEGYAGHLQPIEDGLYIHGQLLKDPNRWRRKHPVSGAEIGVYLYNQQGLHYDGTMITDSLGFYAFKISDDIEGEWNLQLQTKYNDRAAAYSVTVDRHFSPPARYLSPYEVQPIELPEAFQKAKEVAKDIFEEQDTTLQKRDGEYILPTVKIKRRYFTDSSNLPWYDEATGARKSTVYYNVDEAADMIADMGETLPTLFEWLKLKNEFFAGEDMLTEMCKPDSANDYKLEMMIGDVPSDGNYNDVVFKGGLSYKNRPIVWVLNNMYLTVSNYNRNTFHLNHAAGEGWTNNLAGAAEMPTFIDEVKSIYISEDEEHFHNFIRVDELEAMHPVTVYIYSHPTFLAKKKGVRRSFFQGFNVPKEFEMEDYSIVPPMEDFRRTLFWAPDVKTDAEGYANIEFFNNSSCQKIYFSVEGMTPDGKPLVNE